MLSHRRTQIYLLYRVSKEASAESDTGSWVRLDDLLCHDQENSTEPLADTAAARKSTREARREIESRRSAREFQEP
jgi:hypothetical protein